MPNQKQYMEVLICKGRKYSLQLRSLSSSCELEGEQSEFFSHFKFCSKEQTFLN